MAINPDLGALAIQSSGFNPKKETMPIPGIIPFQCCRPQIFKSVAGLQLSDDLIHLAGGLQFFHVSVAISYNPATDDMLVGVDSTGAARTITLKSARVCVGRFYVVKDEGGQAAVNAITVQTEGAETIDGGATKTITAAYGVLRLYCDGTNWFTI